MQTPFAEDRLVGSLLAGRYRITQVLASGGAGTVYRGVQERLGREVAVKVLRSDLHATALREFEHRFLREAALAGRLNSPHVVTVHDFGTDEQSGTHFVVMEFLRGRTLKAAMRDGPMDADQAARLAEGVARGLRHAHGHGLIHRDVKPGNVILWLDDEGVEVPKLVDFGLVKGVHEVGQEVTATGTYMGTPAYMPPEQARGDKDISSRADIYSLGCMLYRMLTGVLPYTSDSPVATALMHIQEPYPAMQERAPQLDVDPALEAIVQLCMHKDPERRPDSAELVTMLKEYRAGGPVTETAEISTLQPAERDALLADAGAVLPPPPANTRVLVGGVFAVSGAATFLCGGIGVLMMTLVQAGSPGPVLPVAESPAAAVESLVPLVEAAPPRLPAADSPPAPAADPPPGPPVEPAPPAPEPAAPLVEAALPPVEVEAPAQPPPAPETAPAPPPPTGEAVTVDGVSFDAAHAARALVFVNEADEAAVRASGVYGRGVGIVLDQRPFASLKAFGDTPYVGTKTVQAVHNATRQ